LKSKALLALLAALALAACAPASPEPAATPVVEAAAVAPVLEPLEVVTSHGPVRFNVAVADDEPERQQGLMFRSVMDENEGMLFDFRKAQPVSFWMKNTLIPLDMIFIGADGRIVNIAANTQPYSLSPVPSDGPVLAVLEIGGGLSAQMGIAPGDRVLHRIFPRS
jgi:uncharacterized membrane protein (UPF0127 family)